MTERYYPVEPGEQPSSADLYIDHELHQAETEDRNINDTAAKLIAGQLYMGQASAFYSLASSGAVDYDGLSQEIVSEYNKPETPTWMKRWYDHIGSYAVEHAGRAPVDGWHELTRDERVDRLLGELGITAVAEDDQAELDEYELGDRSLRAWHDWLTHDGSDGMPTGHLATPCSRYGSTTEACSWWAIAAEIARVQYIGEADDPEGTMGELMRNIVNDDNGEAAALIADWWSAIPRSVREHIGAEDDVRRLDY